MLSINAFSVELVKDPFGILTGQRYEFFLEVEVPEDDEMYSKSGLNLRVIYLVEENKSGMIRYEVFERQTEKYLDFELVAEEEEMVAAFCKANLFSK